MLHTLFIQDYALIQKLQIDFEDGFSVITGETGAGKSIILGALGLLLGQRADVKAIRSGSSKCVIEAHFGVKDNPALHSFLEKNELDDDDECILRREVYATGKSRAFINDTPVQLSQLKEIGERLIDIHSQHQNLLMRTEDFQLNVLDVLASNQSLLAKYETTYKDWKQQEHKLEQLIEKIAREQADKEYLMFQLQKFEEANLQTGEQEELEQERDILTHAEEIKSALFKTNEYLTSEVGGVLERVNSSKNTLQGINNIYPVTIELSERMESCLIELQDISQELQRHEENIEFDQHRLDQVEERLDLIYSLEQRHQLHSVEELLNLQHELQTRLETIDSSEELIEQQRKICEKLKQDLKQEASTLTAQRKTTAAETERQMMEKLVLLGMPNVRFSVEISPRKDFSPKGCDTVHFLFSANKNAPLHPLSEVASGGEISRVMLSVKALISDVTSLPTIIFDEIDTGVSGAVAERMALIMQQIGKNGRQVISITHLPQIAARGRMHYKVYKKDNEQETVSYIRQLTPEERVEEIAHMLSGTTLTPQALSNAKVLLGESS